MTKDKKIIFVDLDGTLCASGGVVSDRTVEAVKKVRKAGHEVVICTGRSVSGIRKIFERTGIRYAVYSAGGGIFDFEEKKILFEKLMSKRETELLYDYCVREDLFALISVGEERYISASRNRDKMGSSTFVTFDETPHDFIKNNNITQFVTFGENIEGLRNVLMFSKGLERTKVSNMSRKIMTDFSGEVYKTETPFIDFGHAIASKGSGIRAFCKLFDLDIKNTVCMGDDYNDIAMFETAYYKVAMGNALPQLKSMADFVTDTNDNDGVAKFLEGLI